MKITTTNRKTVLLFNNKEQRTKAVDYLLGINEPFNTIRGNGVVIVKAATYKKYCLDLVFNEAAIYSSFTYKHSK
jgi:hypothetical protein